MNEKYINPNTINSLKEILYQFDTNKKIESVLFFMADKEKYANNDLKPLLNSTAKPIIGGIFPELIVNGERKETGVLLIPLSFKLNTQLLDLSLSSDQMLEQLETVQKNSIETSSCLFIFADALSENKEILIETLFNFFGINPSYIGAGAGSLDFKSFPCIITNNGIYKNSAVIGWAHKKIALGVAHGWEPISIPLKVTEANGNEVISINWKSAFEVYKEIVQNHSNRSFRDSNFFDIAKSYPIGISKLDAEQVVRDPFKIVNNTIHFIDSINEGEYIQILHGDINSLLSGAELAKEKAQLKSTKNMQQNFVFCIDCISRVLYLQEDFNKELAIIKKGTEAFGILSIGEIANSEESFLEIYNKTNVIAIW